MHATHHPTIEGVQAQPRRKEPEGEGSGPKTHANETSACCENTPLPLPSLPVLTAPANRNFHRTIVSSFALTITPTFTFVHTCT